jgi:membrane protease YdiL (CAAX protease family)
MLSLKRANWALLFAVIGFLGTAELLGRFTSLNPYWAEVPFFALLPIWLARQERQSPVAALRLGGFRPEQIFLSVGVYILSLFLTIGVTLITIVVLRRVGFTSWETGGSPLVDPRWSLNQSLFYYAVIPAVCEELFFRGYLMRAYGPVGLRRAVVFNSLLFALLHGSLLRLPVTFTIGVVLSLLALKTGSLIPGMIVHFVNNAVAVALSSGLSRFLPSEVAPSTSPLPAVPQAAIIIFGLLAIFAGLAIRAITRSDQPAEQPSAPEPDSDSEPEPQQEPLWPVLRRTLLSLPVLLVELFYLVLNFRGLH